MAIKTIMDSTLTAIADAIRAKTGKSASMTPLEMPTEIGSISGGGGMDAGLEALIAGTATGNIDATLPEQCKGLGILFFSASVNGSNSLVANLTLRGVKTLGAPSNANNGLIIQSSANLAEIHLPDCTYVGIRRTQLQSTTTWGALTTFDAPKIESLSGGVFYNAQRLQSVTLTSLKTVDQNTFNGASSLNTLELPACTSIGTQAFRSSSLTTLVLENNAVVSLASANAIERTPIASGTGYIYVPRALIDTYKADTNWSTYSAQFRAIEDYTVNGEFVAPSV